MKKLVRMFSFVVVPLAMLACSAETKPTPAPPKPAATGDGGKGTTTASKPKTKVTPKSLDKFKGTAPPDGAQSQGTKSSPKVANTVVPIVDVEVYVFAFDFDEDGTDNQLSWAHFDGRTYLWSEGPIACDDALTDGTGAFVAEINADGTGAYLFSVDQCPTNDLFGCEFDAAGNDTVCGACSWNDAVIACVAAGG